MTAKMNAPFRYFSDQKPGIRVILDVMMLTIWLNLRMAVFIKSVSKERGMQRERERER